MKSNMTVAVVSAILALGTALPAMAQLNTEIDFTTSVPFYAGKVKMPAGSYEIKQPDTSMGELLIQSINGNSSAFVDFIPTYSMEPQQDTNVTFHKSGDVEYLDRISIEGETDEMKVPPVKEESETTSAAGKVVRPVVGN